MSGGRKKVVDFEWEERVEMAPLVGANYINWAMTMVSTFHLVFLLHHDNILETGARDITRRTLGDGSGWAEKKFPHAPGYQVPLTAHRFDDYLIDNAEFDELIGQGLYEVTSFPFSFFSPLDLIVGRLLPQTQTQKSSIRRQWRLLRWSQKSQKKVISSLY